MKAKELMLFDLAKRKKDDKVITVVELRYAETIAAITPDDVYYGDMEDYHESEIEPIPLTPEILKKNGFRYNDLPFVQSWEQFGLSLYLGGDGYRINCGQNVAMVIDSVHQLQHALKLCGIEKEIVI